MKQYLRKARLTFNNGGLIINPSSSVEKHEMRIAFDVTKDLSGNANEASIRIWNLNESHRNALGKEFDEVLLEAGYIPPDGGGNVGVIFHGNLRDVVNERDGADIISTISCGDGDKALRKTTISKTFPKGTPVKTVIEDIYKEFEKQGIKRGEWKGIDDLPPFKRPLTLCGSCEQQMNTLGKSNKFYWSSQNGALEIVKSDEYIGQMVVLTPQTGLIGSPAITDNGVSYTALLNPEIRPNRPVKIESDSLEMNSEGGIYRNGEVTYSGDNREGDFLVSSTAERVQGGKVDEGIK